MRPLAASQSSDVNMVDGHVSTHSVDGSLGSAPSVVNSVGYGQSACDTPPLCASARRHTSHQPPRHSQRQRSPIGSVHGRFGAERTDVGGGVVAVGGGVERAAGERVGGVAVGRL